VPFVRLWMVRLAGEAVNSAAPTGVGGEPVKVVMLRDDGVAGSDAAASVVVSRTSLVVGQSILVTIGVCLLLLRLGHPWSAAAALTVLLTLALLFGVVLVRLQQMGPMRSGTRVLSGLLPRLAALATAGRDRRPAVVVLRAAPRDVLQPAAGTSCPGWSPRRRSGSSSSSSASPSACATPIIDGLAQPVRASAIVIPGALGAQEGAGVAVCAWLGIAREPAMALWLARRVREIVFDIVGFGYMSLAGARDRVVVPRP
jgi:hypothetical protein